MGRRGHRCPAERVSRIIAEAAIEAVLHRLTGLTLSVPAEELGVGVSLWSVRADRLPVKFDAVTDYDEQWHNLTLARA
jgi:cytochrome P450